MVYLSSGWWLFTNWSGLHKHEKKGTGLTIVFNGDGEGRISLPRVLFTRLTLMQTASFQRTLQFRFSGQQPSHYRLSAKKNIKSTVRLVQQTIQCRVECCEDSDVVGVLWHLRNRLFCQVSTPDKTAGFSRLFLWCSREITSEWQAQNSILMTCYYPDLSSASYWLKQISFAAQPIRSTTLTSAVTRHQYEICAFVSQTSFRGETSGGVAKCRPLSQAKNVLDLTQESGEKYFMYCCWCQLLF